MNQHLKDLLHIGLIMLTSALLVLGVLMAYEEWNVLFGIVIVVIGWILVSLVRMFVRGAKA